MNRPSIEYAITRLVAAYPQTKVSPETVAIYTDRLSDLPTDQLVEAIDDVIAESKFFPTVADIRSAHKARYGERLESAYAMFARLRPGGPLEATRQSFLRFNDANGPRDNHPRNPRPDVREIRNQQPIAIDDPRREK